MASRTSFNVERALLLDAKGMLLDIERYDLPLPRNLSSLVSEGLRRILEDARRQVEAAKLRAQKA